MDPFQAVLAGAAEALAHTREMLVVALMLARIMTMVVMTPFLGGKMIPTELKMGIGIMFTIIVWPVARPVIPDQEIPTDPGNFLLLMLTQVMIGFVIGFVCSHIFLAVEMAGRLIDTVRGSSMSEVLVPTSGERATPAGSMYYHLVVVLFFTIGAHALYIEAVFYSFIKIPLHWPLQLGLHSGPFYEHVIHLTGNMLLIAAMVSAPVVAATFITDVVFGILNRVAPQLNAYFMSMPVKAMGGIFLMLVGLYPLVDRLNDYILGTLQAVESTITLFSIPG
jgi:flagellar biosynthetic protein FliR